MSDYYVFRGEKFEGPFTKRDLIEMVATGKAQRTEPCASASQPEVQTVEDVLHQRARGSIPFASTIAKTPQPHGPPRNRGVYIILGLLFGGSGFHSFYAGYHEQGAVQLVMCIIGVVGLVYFPIAGALILLALILGVLKDLLTVTEAADGTPML